MSESFIKTEHLSYTYETGNIGEETPAVRDVSLTIEKGEYVAVLGHNGSGKSTFAKLLNFILEPTSGKIFIDGRDITDETITEDDIYRLRSRIGMVFQNPDNQLVATIVEEDVAFGPENLGVPPQEIRKRVDESLQTVGMTEYIHHEPHRLSGGQKQRVAIAGVLAMHPECIIFDESTAMLDPVGRKEVVQTIHKLNQEENITIINITHYMEEAALADRILVFNDGELLMDGTPAQVFAREKELLAVGLDIPPCVALAKEMRQKGFPVSADAVTPEACAKAIAAAYFQMIGKQGGTEK